MNDNIPSEEYVNRVISGETHSVCVTNGDLAILFIGMLVSPITVGLFVWYGCHLAPALFDWVLGILKGFGA